MAERRPGLDSFCARRRPKSTVGAEESLRRGRTKESPKQESKRASACVCGAAIRRNVRGAGGNESREIRFSKHSLAAFAAGCLPNRSSCRGAVLRFGVAAYLSEVGRPRIARRVPSARPRCKRRLHRRRRIRAIWLGACASSWSLDLFVDLVLHAEARAFDDDRLGVVQDAIEDGGGQRAVVVEDL